MARSNEVTLEQRLIAANNRPSGFDYMRLILAVSVVCSHTINVCYGPAVTGTVWDGPARAFLALILPMFFALSGFLVAGSFERCRTIVSFGGLRVLRLLPALFVDTCVGALLLGTLFTTLPLHEYFASPIFHRYFLNIVGDIHFMLPGVFESNPWPGAINQQLWTLPWELACYISIAIASFIGIAQRPRFFLPAVIALNVAYLIFHTFFRHGGHAVTVSGPILLICFLYGVAGYLFRRKIVWSAKLFWLAAIVAIVGLSVPGGDYFTPLPATYMTVYLGLLQPRRNKIVTSGDYSYGIFLYGFPVQQAVTAVLGEAGHHWYINLAVALPATVAFAMFSWWCVEKPALRLRPYLIRIEDFCIRAAEALPGGRFFVPKLGVRAMQPAPKSANP